VRILFVGDIFGRPGRDAVRGWVPSLRRERGIDFAIGNAENAAGGRGLTASTAKELDKAEQDLQQKRAAVEQLKASLSEQKGKVEAARQALAALETARTELLSKKDAISALLLAAKSAEAAANAKLELARAQGFPDSYVFNGTKTDQIAAIGNSVVPQVMAALTRANLG
jgi:site-specific DNA-cytosine methylase